VPHIKALKSRYSFPSHRYIYVNFVDICMPYFALHCPTLFYFAGYIFSGRSCLRKCASAFNLVPAFTGMNGT
jgi:hypothetical protein